MGLRLETLQPAELNNWPWVSSCLFCNCQALRSGSASRFGTPRCLRRKRRKLPQWSSSTRLMWMVRVPVPSCTQAAAIHC